LVEERCPVADFPESDELLSLVVFFEEAAAIAQAQGMLMGRFDVSPEEALDLLAVAAELDGLSTYEVASNLLTNRQWCS
jgi:hypothetical protein